MEGMEMTDTTDNDVFDEGFEQAYRVIKGNSARLPRGPKKRWILKDRTPLQCDIIAGIAATTGLQAVNASEIS
jgi:hypothetical protein